MFWRLENILRAHLDSDKRQLFSSQRRRRQASRSFLALVNYQCDQMSRLHVQHLAIYDIENMPNVKKLQGRLKNLANFYHFY